MNMDIKVLSMASINYEKGVERFLGDADLYIRVLSLFIEDRALDRAKVEIEAENDEALRMCIHEVKGLSANAEMSMLNTASCDLIDLLRNKTYSREEVFLYFSKFEEAYILTKQAIASIVGD